jgi:hypothetical protein
VSPRAPAVAPGAPRRPQSAPDLDKMLPTSSDWDNAPTATGMPDDPPRAVPPVEPSPGAITKPMDRDETPIAPPTATNTTRGIGGAAALAATAMPAMNTSAREETWTIVRAAVTEAIAPVLAKQKDLDKRLNELEARLERAAAQAAQATQTASSAQEAAHQSASAAHVASEKAAAAAASLPPSPNAAPATLASRGATATQRLASIPVALGSIPPGGSTFPTIPELRKPVISPSGHASLPPQGYGVVVAAPVIRESLDLEGVSFGADELKGFDGGARKRMIVKIVAFLMILIAAGAVIATILSHQGGGVE